MRTWMADLIGLAIGFALGGVVLMHFWPRLEQVRLPTIAMLLPAPRETPLPQVQVPAPQPAPRQVVVAPPAPAPLPDITVNIPAPAPMPEITDPDEPDQDDNTPPPNTLVSGTGFFVADDLVMTAAHVVPGCRRAAIASPRIQLTPVSIAARDSHNDIALLHTSGVTAPAVLAIGRPEAGDNRVFMLGYPSSAGMLVPEATWGQLENEKLQHVPSYDPRQHILLEFKRCPARL